MKATATHREDTLLDLQRGLRIVGHLLESGPGDSGWVFWADLVAQQSAKWYRMVDEHMDGEGAGVFPEEALVEEALGLLAAINATAALVGTGGSSYADTQRHEAGESAWVHALDGFLANRIRHVLEQVAAEEEVAHA